MKRKIALSGVKPTGRLHIGNYFGAIKQFIELEKEYDCYYFIANYHALTSVSDKRELETDSLNVAIDYLALGLNPEKTTLYLQSDVPEVTELTWILNTLTTMPYLMRAHAYKDAEAKNKEVNVGLFDYPILMASDILIQDSDVVPVGQDQKQHIEIARDMAEKFNKTFGETFKIPEPLILEELKAVPGTDGRKMSKSYGNTIGIFAERKEIEKGVMSIPTDSRGVEETKDPDTCNIFALHKIFSKKDINELETRYRNGKIGYKESKEILIENIESFVAPLRKKRMEIEKNPDDVRMILKAGGLKAKERAHAKMTEVRKKVGLNI